MKKNDNLKTAEKFESFIQENKTILLMLGLAFIAVIFAITVTDPVGIIPPSVDQTCCDSLCFRATGYMECESYTQQSIICQIPQNLTNTLPELRGVTPIQIFEVYNISMVCPVNESVK
jgi:hypothetical protein